MQRIRRFVVVEIISPDDRYGRLTHRLEDYRRWGVPHVWLIDPKNRTASRAVRSDNGAVLEEVPSGELTVPGMPILVRIGELFAKLDQF